MKEYSRRNPADWLEGRLLELYQGTEGPHGSPDPVECFLLWQAAAAAGGDVLEIGSWRGRSACFLADAAGGAGHRVYCLDWFRGDDTGGAHPDRSVMEAALEEFRLSGDVVIMEGDSRAFDYAGVGPFAMVFYDGDHAESATFESIMNAKPAMTLGAEVWIHDADWPSSRQAIERLCGEGFERVKHFDVWEGLAVIRRLA